MPSLDILSNDKFQVDIITIGCEDQLQKRNTLKGLAMQKIVKLAMKNNSEDKSIKSIFEHLTENQAEYFIIEKPFKINTKYYYRKWQYAHIDDFPDFMEIQVRNQLINADWKICNFCGQKIKASEQFSRKCWKCKKGWFHSSKEKTNNWVYFSRGSKERLLQILLDEGYLKYAKINKRLDFFQFTDGIFSIYEAKNKEESGLSSRDLRKTLIYPFIVNRSGYQVKKLIVIFNGQITKELKKELQRGYGKEFPFSIELWPVKHFLNENNIFVKKILVKNIDNNYSYEIVKGLSNKIIIDLTNIS
ncbi:MAG: hypothetical protein FK734_13825 [Asgard group archaeon]|nr:hypothetical protein [Asgard group archaeon]